MLVQVIGGSDPNNTQKLEMWVTFGVDFLVLPADNHSLSAHTALWWGNLTRTTPLGTREFIWRAHSDSEALAVLEEIIRLLPPAIAQIEEKFQTWHDVLLYLDPNVRDMLDPPGRVSEWKLPGVL